MPGLGQRLELLVAQPQEVVRVEPRIVQLFRCQGAAFPVGTLILLAQRHAEVGVENGGQTDLRPPQCARRAHGVEDVRELETVAAPEADDVVFGGMKHLLLRGIGEDGCQSTQVWQPDRINDEVSIRRGELDEAHALPIGVKAVGFGVDGDDRTGSEGLDESVESIVVGNECGRRQRRGGHPIAIVEGLTPLYVKTRVQAAWMIVWRARKSVMTRW